MSTAASFTSLSWRRMGNVPPYRPPNLNHFRFNLTGLLVLELGNFRFFFQISGVLGKAFFQKIVTTDFFLILYIVRALVDLRYIVCFMCPNLVVFLLHVIEKYFYLAFYGIFACHTGFIRPPAEQSEAGGGREVCPLTDHQIWTGCDWNWSRYRGRKLYGQKTRKKHVLSPLEAVRNRQVI